MKPLFYYFLLLTVFFSSCAKESNDDSNSQNCKVVGIRGKFFDQFYNNATVSYDLNNEIKSFICTSDTGFTSFTVKYQEDLAIVSNQKYGDYVYLFDAKKRVNRASFGNNGQNYQYSYNSDGYIDIIIGNGYEMKCFYSSVGNLIKIYGTNVRNDRTVTFDFAYDLNSSAVNLIDDSNPLSYLTVYPSLLPRLTSYGIISKNMLVSAKITEESALNNFKSERSYSLSYTRDSNNKIVSITRLGDNYSKVFSFKYECN